MFGPAVIKTHHCGLIVVNPQRFPITIISQSRPQFSKSNLNIYHDINTIYFQSTLN